MNVNNSTQGNQTWTSTWTPPIPVHTAITLWSLLLIWSLTGNVLVIAVVYWNQKLKTNMNYLIVNMAVSDLLVPLVAVPWFISVRVTDGDWLVDGPLGEALCKLVPFLSLVSFFVSSISLVIIAFHRFMAVVYPTLIHALNRKTKWIAISFPWILAMALFSPSFHTYRLTNISGYVRCVYSWSVGIDDWKAETIFILITFMIGFAVPLIIIIILYTVTVYKLRENLNNIIGLIAEETKRSRQRRNRRIFSMSVTIVVAFTICWCPYHILYLMFLNKHPSISPGEPDLLKMNFAFIYVWCLLAAINPCIYFLFLRDFRQGLKRLCCGKTAPPNELIFTRTPDGDNNQDSTKHTTAHQ